MRKKQIWISHGNTTHPLEERYDCLECIQLELEYLQELKRVGGQSNLLKELKKKHVHN